MAKTVKLADIAEVLGVSTVTVSKALSDQKGVSEELRDKIKSLAHEMGYVRPAVAKKAQADGSYNIGVLISEKYLNKYDSFYWQMYQEVNKCATTRSCFCLMEIVSDEDEQNKTLPMMIEEHKADGVIIIGKLSRDYLLTLEELGGVPCLYLDFYDEVKIVDAVISNSFYGTYLLTNYLYNSGHRKIAFVGTPNATKSITDRYLGYCKSLLEHNIARRDDYVIHDRTEDNSRMVQEEELYFPEDMPTAFVCNCDLTAAYMIRKLKQEGYRVPEDIAVVGFDNYLYPGICDVGITTYEVDMPAMARQAVKGIIKKISRSNYKTGIVIVEGRIIFRESTKQ